VISHDHTGKGKEGKEEEPPGPELKKENRSLSLHAGTQVGAHPAWAIEREKKSMEPPIEVAKKQHALHFFPLGRGGGKRK